MDYCEEMSISLNWACKSKANTNIPNNSINIPNNIRIHAPLKVYTLFMIELKHIFQDITRITSDPTHLENKFNMENNVKQNCIDSKLVEKKDD